MRRNPFPFVEPTFGDDFHLRGATGYSQYVGGRKSAHNASFDKAGVTQALATFLYLERAGNLRSATNVPVPQNKAVCVDLNRRRFFAGVTPYNDIAIKELVSADGQPPYTRTVVNWSEWVQQHPYPATDWFKPTTKNNPSPAQRRALLRRLDMEGEETRENPYDRPELPAAAGGGYRWAYSVFGRATGAPAAGALARGETGMSATSERALSDMLASLQRAFPDLPEPTLVAVRRQKNGRSLYNVSVKGEYSGGADIEPLDAEEVSEALRAARSNPVWIRPEGSARTRRMETAYDEAYDNPGRAAYTAFVQASKATGKTPAQIKAAYAKKRADEKPIHPKKLVQLAETEIVAATREHIGDPSFLWSSGMMERDLDHGVIQIVLSSSKHTAWEVDDPKYVAALRAISKKYAPKGLKMTVAVRNPRALGAAQRNPSSPIPSNAPPEVRRVAEALIRNGAEVELPADLAVYVRLNDAGEWVVGPNFEGAGSGMTCKNGKWYYIEAYGERKLMRNGLAEALASADIWYTG